MRERLTHIEGVEEFTELQALELICHEVVSLTSRYLGVAEEGCVSYKVSFPTKVDVDHLLDDEVRDPGAYDDPLTTADVPTHPIDLMASCRQI
eukprot:1760540-Amphidinium_carterae.1